MPAEDTRDRESAAQSNVVMPTNPLFPYDKAIFKMLKQLFDEVYYVDTYENALQVNAKAHEGKILMPFISLYRLGDYSIALEAYNDWAVRSGYRNTVQGKAEFEDKRIAMHTLPVTLQYQIDVWATRRDVVDGITAELLMEFKEHPHFKAKIQDMGQEQTLTEFDFLIDDSVVDNSGITEFEDTGRFYRLTLTGTVPMAAIFRVDVFSRIDKQIVEISDIKKEVEKEKLPYTNKITYGQESIEATNLLDEYGRLHTDEDDS